MNKNNKKRTNLKGVWSKKIRQMMGNVVVGGQQ